MANIIDNVIDHATGWIAIVIDDEMYHVKCNEYHQCVKYHVCNLFDKHADKACSGLLSVRTLGETARSAEIGNDQKERSKHGEVELR